MSTPVSIPYHYHEVARHFANLRQRLSSMEQPSSQSRESIRLLHPRQAINQWLKQLQAITRRLRHDFINLSSQILARHNKPTYPQLQRHLIPLQQQVGALINLQAHITRHRFPASHRQGKLLLSQCLARVSCNLQKIFSFFSQTMTSPQGETITCRQQITCPTEIAALKKWLRSQKEQKRQSWRTLGARIYQSFLPARLVSGS